MSQGEPKIALVHDELIRRGGAEVAFEEMLQIFPQADVFALYAGGSQLTLPDGSVRPIRTSFVQSFPRWMRRHPKYVLPLLPYAAEQFDFSQYDLVLSSASGFAKAVVTRANVPHVCYCHTPTRYLWESRTAHSARHVANPAAALLLHYLRIADFAAAQRVDVWLANSKYTQQRIQKYYRRPSTVVYPPIRTGFFVPGHRVRTHFLAVGRLSPSKRLADAIAVCEKLRLPLTIVGVGSDYPRLRRLAGRYTTFVGYASDVTLRELYRTARAVLQPGVEDFGMTSAEALACGTPVVAQAAGGVREIVTNRQHGILYSGYGTEALAEGIRQFLEWEPRRNIEVLQRRAMEFSSARFRDQLKNSLAEILARRNGESDAIYAVHPKHRTVSV